MPFIAYVEKRFNASSQIVIDRALEILARYNGQSVTLRQLYYRFVAEGWLPNKLQSYKRLSSIINDARLAGVIDWHAIEDRTRELAVNSHWETPADIFDSCERSYANDKWQGQKHHVEVWIEKDALVGVIDDVCRRNDVAYFSCRGFTSQSEMWVGGIRLKEYAKAGYENVVIHLGDHDPSGMDMTRDVDERLAMFLRPTAKEAAEYPHLRTASVKVERIALNWNQIQQYQPPPNPAKPTDSRFRAYAEQFGEECWELDALEPGVIDALIEKTIHRYRDKKKYDARVALQEANRARIAVVAKAERKREK